MHFHVYDVFYWLYFHQRVSAAFTAIFRVLLLLQESTDTNVVSSVAVTP